MTNMNFFNNFCWRHKNLKSRNLNVHDCTTIIIPKIQVETRKKKTKKLLKLVKNVFIGLEKPMLVDWKIHYLYSLC